MLRNNKGFTLMEILVVVTIIGILAAIAVPSYIYAVEQGKKDACEANIQILNTQIERYRLEKGSLINIEDVNCLAEYLYEEGYLNEKVKCPFDGTYSIDLKYPDDERRERQIAVCIHDNTEEDTNGD